MVSDFLNGLIEFEDIWAVYNAVFEQFKAEETYHTEVELESLFYCVQDEVDAYLRRRHLRLSTEDEGDEWPYE